MAIREPFPELDELLASTGEGGQRMATIDAAEGAVFDVKTTVV